jgi:hypothetical protein
MMGVLDETGILEYGQVYVQVSVQMHSPDTKFHSISGNVAIVKNPALAIG